MHQSVLSPQVLLQGSRDRNSISASWSQPCADQLCALTQIRSLHKDLAAATMAAATTAAAGGPALTCRLCLGCCGTAGPPGSSLSPSLACPLWLRTARGPAAGSPRECCCLQPNEGSAEPALSQELCPGHSRGLILSESHCHLRPRIFSRGKAGSKQLDIC